MNYFANDSELMANIVKGNLRYIGDYMVFSATPDVKAPQGNWFRNKSKENRSYENHRDEKLRTALLEVKNIDIKFFEFIMDKLNMSVWLFDEETDRRKAVASHTADEVKYAVHDVYDDYGLNLSDEPIGFATITSTGDSSADKATAIRAALNITDGEGFYAARIITDDDISSKINELHDKINRWNAGY